MMSIKTWIAPLVVSACACGASISAQELPPGSPYDALSSWSFSDTNSWKSDLGYKPLSFTNISMSDLGDGPAVVVDSPSPAWLRYPVMDMGQTNLIVGNIGSLLFWFAPSWSGTNAGGTGPGVWGRLIEVGSYTTNASLGWWSLYTDPQGCNLFFSAQTNGATAVYLSAPIAWETNRWHFVALTYSQTNASLYLDGTLATNASGATVWPAETVSTNGFCLGSSADGANQAHGMFDSLTTYGYVLTARSISNYFNGTDIDYWGNPMNTANLAKVPYDPPAPAPGFRAIMGSGSVRQIGIAAGCATNASVWMTNVTAKLTNNGTMNLTFKVGGGSPGVAYDVFGSDGLIGNSIANAEWVWLGQAYACSTNVITNLPAGSALFALGTDRDSDGDGLTDAFEALVSKTDPHNPDTYGNDVPDWWQFVHFGSSVMDPYGDADGDGWSNWQEFQNGADPFGFDTPPPPRNVVAKVDGTGTNITITWTSGGGPVTNYVIERSEAHWDTDIYASTIGSASPTTFTFSDTSVYPLNRTAYEQPAYFIRAYFTNGSSAVSARATVSQAALGTELTVLRGPQAKPYVAVASLPADLSSVQLFWYVYPNYVSTNISAASLNNGIAPLPAAAFDGLPSAGFTWEYQLLASNSDFAETYVAYASPVMNNAEEAWTSGVSAYNFVDARRHLKENLMFLLRAAGRNTAFGYDYALETVSTGYPYSPDLTANPESKLVRPLGSTNYEYYGFHYYSPHLGYSVILELRPVVENFVWSNFVYNPDTFETTGFARDCPITSIRALADPLNYSYSGSGTESNVPVAMLNANATWIYYGGVWPDEDDCGLARDIGIGTNGSGKFLMSSGVKNCFGLNIQSVQVDFGPSPLEPGVASTVTDERNPINCWPQTDIPTLSTVGYFFTSQTPYFNYNDAYGTPRPPLPGSPDFTVTNTSPVLITSIGQSMNVAGWAKMAISNGYSNKFAYLEQYFDKAYLIGTNGAATTNENGLLSPYGEFFPTQPGPTALATMPDIDTGQRGTGVVNVIKLQVDVNHDGIMDLSYAGPDNTLWVRPLVFWINNDHDEPGTGGNADQDLVVPPNRPDYTYGNIRCQRNLEDLARLWVCGLPKLPPSQGYAVTLSMSPSSGNPAINLYAAYGTNSGNGYLKDTNVAAGQFTKVYLGDQLMIDYAKSVAQVSASQSYNLPLSSDGTPQYTNFLFEGVATNSSSGQLTLTISQTTAQGSNVLAQTSAWLELHDIKDFYERVVITNITTGAISNWSSGIETVQYPVVSDANESQDIVIFVHGINNTVTDWLTSSDTMFKRLYWSGHHGKFATVHWPCKFLPWNALHPFDFNLSEFYGYKSAAAFRAYLNGLRTRFPNYRIHIVAHSQGNAVASEALSQGAPFDTYILTQAAMPASAYEVNAPTNADLVYADTPPAGEPTPQWQPMGYRGAYTNLTGQIINFFNTSDYALGWWASNQRLSKPDGLPGARNYTSDGTNGYAILDIDLYRRVTDPEECRGMVSRSRTLAIGAQGPVTGQTTQGVITNSVNLQTQFGFYDTRPEHSAEFTRPIQTVRPYYLQLLRSCQIQPAP